MRQWRGFDPSYRHEAFWMTLRSATVPLVSGRGFPPSLNLVEWRWQAPTVMNPESWDIAHRIRADIRAIKNHASVLIPAASKRADPLTYQPGTGPYTLKISTHTTAATFLSLWFGFSLIIAQGHGGRTPAVRAFYTSYGSHPFSHRIA